MPSFKWIEWLLYEILVRNTETQTDARTHGWMLTILMSPPKFINGDKNDEIEFTCNDGSTLVAMEALTAWKSTCMWWAWLVLNCPHLAPLARSKLRLCPANHRAGYFSNLACDWQSIVWAYSDDPANFLVLWQCYTENFLCYENMDSCNSLPSCYNTENTSAFPIHRIAAIMRRILHIILHGE